MHRPVAITKITRKLVPHGLPVAIYRCISINLNVGEKLNFSCNLFQKVKFSYILD